MDLDISTEGNLNVNDIIGISGRNILECRIWDGNDE